MKEAYLYKKLDNNRVRCDLCNFRCIIEDGKRGICGVRENRDGKLYSLTYSKAVAKSVDPIEKKPLFHFLPGTKSYSIATVGCNFRCLFCQNYNISQYPIEHNGSIVGEDYTPEKIVKDAVNSGCRSIAYTYTEPTIFFEYALDTAKLAKEKGLKNIFITNGYMTKEAVDMMDGLIDAANIDLKAFSDAYYYQVVGGVKIKHVLDTIEYMKSKNMWLEITTLIVPTLNDNPVEIMELINFIYDLDPAIPWHVSRFYPTYKLIELPPTPINTVVHLAQMGKEMGLKYVYTGNIKNDSGGNTYCPKCSKPLIIRNGFEVLKYDIKDGKCPYCGEKIDIVE